MTYGRPWPARASAMDLVHAVLLSFPIACFSLTVLTDIAYWRTLNLLWLHFSEWLLLAGLVFGILAAIALLLDWAFRRIWLSWPMVSGGIVVLLLATLNNFIHTADGWTAVVPWGMTVSILTVFAMLVTGLFGRWGARHV
jgi:Predicted membrane protein